MPADGRAPRGFTLTELLAVLAIVLIVVAGSIGVWLALAGTVAPGQATAVVQAMLVGARDYAVSNGVMTRVVFENSLANVENGTKMYLEYYDTDPSKLAWERVPRRGPLDAGRQVFVLTGAPDLNPSEVADREAVIKKLASYAFTNVDTDTGYLKANAAFRTDQPRQDTFYVTFDAAGTLAADVSPANPSLLTIVQVPGAGRRVGEYQFYILNANTGTQLVFD